MSFLYPDFLYGLSLVAVPIIIHFFNFRRYKRQEFTQVKLLEEATKVKRRFRQIRDLLVLAARVLAVACLVIAFAHPIPPELKNHTAETSFVSVYLDNSFSMGRENENGDLLSGAKLRLEELTEGFGDGAQFQLITNDLEAVNRDFVSKELFLEAVDEVELSPNRADLHQLDQFQVSDLSNHSGQRVLVWISDFQRNQLGHFDSVSDSLIKRYWLHMEAAQTSNLSIDSAWFEQPVFSQGQTARLKVIVRNYGDKPLDDRSIYVYENGAQKALQKFGVLPGQSVELDLFYQIGTTGWNQVRLSVEDYPVVFDNDFYLSYFVDPIKRVLQLFDASANGQISRVYADNEEFILEAQSIARFNLAQVAGFDLVLLDQITSLPSGVLDRLLDHVRNGANLVIVPPPGPELAPMSFAKGKFGIEYALWVQGDVRVKDLDMDNPFFDNVFDGNPANTDFPKVFGYYQTKTSTQSLANPLIALSNEDVFLYEADEGNGKVFLSTAPFDQESTTLVRNGLFVPLLFKFATHTSSQTAHGYFIDQSPLLTRLGYGASNVNLVLAKDDKSFIPNYILKNGRLNLWKDGIREAGNYALADGKAPDTLLALYGFNYQRTESDMACMQDSELEDIAEGLGINVLKGSDINLAATFADLVNANRLWQFFLLMALGFLLFEIIAIKLPGTWMSFSKTRNA
ncbi:MAG: BatA domain-containing protein [Bacteroidetes bacterium]|nr:BatA domain-containing protein [Bacteroidota bacterium]